MAFLEYRKRDTLIHNLHPISKVTIFLALIVIVGLYWDFKYLLLTCIVSAILYFLAKVPRSWLKPIITILLVSLPLQLWLAVLQTNPELYVVYPREVVATEVFVINLGFLGRVGITYGNMLWLLGWVLKWIAILFAVSVFTYSTSPLEIAHLMLLLRLPQLLTYTYIVAMRFIPYLQRVYREIMSIQRLRGWKRPSKINVKKWFESLPPIMKPFLSRTFLLSEEVSTAAQMRAFGSGKITPLIEHRIPLRDLIISALSMIAMVLAIIALVIYKVGLI